MTLLDLYNRIKASNINQEITLVPDIINEGNIHDTLVSIINTTKFQILPDQSKTIIQQDNIVLVGSSSALEIASNVNIVFSESSGILACDITFEFDNTWELGNVSWFKFEKSELQFFISEDNLPLRGKIGGIMDFGVEASIFLNVPTNNVWLWSCIFSKPYPGIDTFFHMVGGDDITKKFPEPISTFTDIGIKEIDIDYNSKRNKLSSIKFTIATNHSWHLFPTLFPKLDLQITDLNISCKVNMNQQSNFGPLDKYQFGIIGQLNIKDKIKLNLSAIQQRGNGWIIGAMTPANDEISLADIAYLFIDNQTHVPSELAEVAFSGVGISISTGNSSLAFTASSAHSWQLTDSFAIDNFNIKVNRNPTSDNSVNGELSMGFQIKELNIQLYAELGEISDSGWNFSADIKVTEGISITELINDLAGKLNISTSLPDPLAKLAIEHIGVTFNTQTKDFTFSIETKFPIDGKELDAVIDVAITHNDGKYTRKFSGVIKVGDLEFDLIFKQDQGADTIFLAAFENHAGGDQSIQPLVKLITDNKDIIDASKGISFSLKDALLLIDKNQTETKVLFGLDIGGGMDISKLPLVGKMVPENSTVKMTFQPLLTSKNFSTTELDSVRTLVPTGGFQLPQKDITDRLGFNIQLMIGDQKFDLSLPIYLNDVKKQPSTNTLPKTTTTSDKTTTGSPPAASGKIKWFKIQKKLGPVEFGRVGVQFEDSKLYFLIDASLALAGLTISLDGLYVASKLKPIHPTFGLHGLGIDYKKGSLEIGGAFLRKTNVDPVDNSTYDSYDGAAIIRTEKFTLAAIGSYAYYQGHPSLFIYAYLGVPLGGPAFFFVTGLAAGFGYNRRLVIPTLEEVRNFPLVKIAMSNDGGNLTEEINSLHDLIPPATGDYFVAVGIRFSSFEIIDSFILLTVSFGNEFEVDVLGLSTLVIPTPAAGSSIEPLAEVQLALKAVFNPGKGFLKVRAGLTSQSFILSRDCHLTGGFAFYVWFKDNPEEGASAGDFVLTIGGYHPRFKPPSYYPKVAPLGFNWQVSKELLIKGDFYFALVPSAVMAGGHLSATWNSGNLKAWFKIGADFIISWKPYFYDAEMYLDMGVSYTYHLFGTHHLKVELGADLHIWGPEFSGKATVHLWIITFDVKFGAHTNQDPPVLKWNEFREGFLPSKEKWSSISVTKGLVKKLGTESVPVYVVNPKDLEFETGAAIPITSSKNGDLGDSNKTIYIGSMKIDGKNDASGNADASDKITSKYNIKIKKGTTDVTNHFSFSPIKKNVPAALWGPEFKHSENEGDDKRMIKNACMGFSIKGTPPKPSDQTHDVDTKNLLNEIIPFGKDIIYQDSKTLNGNFLKNSGVKKSIIDNLEAKDNTRNDLLKSLGFEEAFHPNKELVDELILTV